MLLYSISVSRRVSSEWLSDRTGITGVNLMFQDISATQIVLVHGKRIGIFNQDLKQLFTIFT
jgi:hypothetical protein